jgi:hypothetical protein
MREVVPTVRSLVIGASSTGAFQSDIKAARKSPLNGADGGTFQSRSPYLGLKSRPKEHT